MTATHSVPPQRLNRRRLTFVLAVVGAVITTALVVGFALRAEARVLTGNETRGRTVIQSGETWTFDPSRNITLVMTGNLVVNGTLEMKPNPGFTHVIEFRGNESNFVGGGMDEIQSDTGLWVMGSGRLLIEGEDKPAWDYKWHSSWNGDEVYAAPNTPGSYGFTRINNAGQVPGKNALGYNTELLNLSRNVIIRGTTSNYTHVFIRSTRPSTIKNALIRYVAPNFGNFESNTGRYGLHFHHNHHGSHGTVVDGVVIRDTQTHAFVPHESHGITFRNVIAYNVRGEAYWWDPGDLANDIVYDRAVAAGVRGAENGEHHSMGAFNLGLGTNMTVSNSVVVGMRQENAAQRSAYLWPEDEEGTWHFRNNRAHNNEVNGIFVWQNNEERHIIEDFTAYYNGQSGIEHGAYTNSYVYNGLTLLENGTAAIHSHANGEPGSGGWVDTQIWANIKTNGGRLLIDEHEREPETPVRFINCDFGSVDVNDEGGAEPGRYDFINCGLERNDFDLSGAHPETVFRVQRSNGTAFRLTGTGSLSNISKFYNGKPIPGGGSAPGGFNDVAGNTHQNAIVWLAEEGITKGCNPPANDRFCPNDPVTRGQMAAFLGRAFGYTNAGNGDYFEDTGGTTFEGDIDRLRVAGVTLGCNPPSNDRYCPDDPVTRGQMSAFLGRAFDYTNAGSGDYFEDTRGNTFEQDIDRLRVAGVTRGCNPPANDRYCPDNPVTRGEMATFLYRAMTD